MHSILLLEDDIELNGTIKQFLEYLGYKVFVAFDAEVAKDIVYENSIDLMLLDVKVPKQSGFDLLKELRDSGNTTPAIFITSLNTIDDLSRGFDAGCDDYIKKPFELKELQLRVQAAIKKSFNATSNRVKIDENIEFDIDNFKLFINQKEQTLKQKEAKLLALFLKNRGKSLTYEQIFNAIWDYSQEPNSHSLRTYIHKLRQLIGKDRIKTIKNQGYLFE